jgi:hypothetical protein
MPRPKQWVGTKVNVQGGTIGPRDYVLPKPFDQFIFERANRAATLQERISEKQTAKIAETYKANLERAAQSDSMRAMHQDFNSLPPPQMWQASPPQNLCRSRRQSGWMRS